MTLHPHQGTAPPRRRRLGRCSGDRRHRLRRVLRSRAPPRRAEGLRRVRVGSCASSGDGTSVTAPTGHVVDCEDGGRALLVKVCAADEFPGEPAAPDASTLQLCDADTDVTSVPFLRHVTYDTDGKPAGFTDTDLQLAPYTLRHRRRCQTGGDEPEPCPVQNVVQRPRCDDPDGDSVADTCYVELVGFGSRP